MTKNHRDISVAIRPVIPTRSRSIQENSLDWEINRQPRDEFAKRALGFGITIVIGFPTLLRPWCARPGLQKPRAVANKPETCSVQYDVATGHFESREARPGLRGAPPPSIAPARRAGAFAMLMCIASTSPVVAAIASTARRETPRRSVTWLRTTWVIGSPVSSVNTPVRPIEHPGLTAARGEVRLVGPGRQCRQGIPAAPGPNGRSRRRPRRCSRETRAPGHPAPQQHEPSRMAG